MAIAYDIETGRVSMGNWNGILEEWFYLLTTARREVYSLMIIKQTIKQMF